MSYSWTRFGVGVALGLVALALLFVAISYFYLSLLLLFISNVLIAQVPGAPSDQNSAVSGSSDLEEWRQLGRDLVKGLRDAIVPLFVLVLILFVWNFAVDRYPFLADIPEDYGELLAAMLLAVMWLVQVVAAYRSGKQRGLSSSS